MKRIGRLLVLALMLLGSPQLVRAAGSFEEVFNQAKTAYAERAFNAARRLAETALNASQGEIPPGDPKLFDLHAILAGSAHWFGDAAEEEAQLKQVLAILEANHGGPDSINAAFGMEALAHLYVRTGRIDEAERLFRKIIDIRKIMVIGGVDPFKARHIANLASVALARSDWQGAFDGFRDAIRLIDFNATKNTNAEDLADLSSETNSWTFIGLSQAAWQLTNVSPTSGQDYADEAFKAMQWKWRTTASAALLRASVRAYADDPELSAKQRLVEDLQQKIAAVEQQIGALHQSAPGLTDEQMGAYLSVDQDALIKAMQKSMEIGQKMLNLMQTCPADCAAEIADLQRQKDEIDAASMKMVAPVTEMEAGRKDQPADEAFEKERVRLYEERDRLQRELAQAKTDLDSMAPRKTERSPGNPDFLTEPEPIAIAEVEQLLGKDDALVSFLVGQDTSFVWAVSRDGFAWSPVKLGERQLAERVGALLTGIRPGAEARGAVALAQSKDSPGEFDLTAAYSLYADLLGPVEGLIAGKHHLYVAPSSALTSLPFHVLLTKAPDAALRGADALRHADWLIRRHAVTVLPSVVSLRAIRAFTDTGRAKDPFIGYGNPLFQQPENSEDPADSARGLSSYFNGASADVSALRRLRPLPDTAEEIRFVAHALGAGDDDVLLGADATETNLKTREMDSYRVVHFATHGLVGGELIGLAEPALVLSPPAQASEQDDGLLTASEIARLRLNADWVVLSACNTASGETVGAEAFSGLARAFFYAGARALLVSYWPVYSSAAVSLTTSAVSELEADPAIGRAEALRRSMLKIVETGSAQQLKPAYWAAFTVMGDGGEK